MRGVRGPRYTPRRNLNAGLRTSSSYQGRQDAKGAREWWTKKPLAERLRLAVAEAVEGAHLECRREGEEISVAFVARQVGEDANPELVRDALLAELASYRPHYDCRECDGSGEKIDQRERRYTCGGCAGKGEAGRPRLVDDAERAA